MSMKRIFKIIVVMILVVLMSLVILWGIITWQSNTSDFWKFLGFVTWWVLGVLVWSHTLVKTFSKLLDVEEKK